MTGCTNVRPRGTAADEHVGSHQLVDRGGELVVADLGDLPGEPRARLEAEHRAAPARASASADSRLSIAREIVAGPEAGDGARGRREGHVVAGADQLVEQGAGEERVAAAGGVHRGDHLGARRRAVGGVERRHGGARERLGQHPLDVRRHRAAR